MMPNIVLKNNAAKATEMTAATAMITMLAMITITIKHPWQNNENIHGKIMRHGRSWERQERPRQGGGERRRASLPPPQITPGSPHVTVNNFLLMTSTPTPSLPLSFADGGLPWDMVT